ncbi:MAG: hypothetical protein ACETWK_14555 [Candidatus Aminicenantaceae bacterium]
MQKVKKETELHIIARNETGILGRILGTLANAGINLRAMCTYSEKDRCNFLLITSNNKKAEKALKTLGYKVSTSEVVTVQIGDRIGAGAEIGVLLANAVIDIDYCYGTSPGLGEALLVFKTSDNNKAVETLK